MKTSLSLSFDGENNLSRCFSVEQHGRLVSCSPDRIGTNRRRESWHPDVRHGANLCRVQQPKENITMRSTITALIVAAGLGFAASAQAAPAPVASGQGLADSPIVHVQSRMERRMMRNRMERRMMRRGMERRMMRNRTERRMMRRGM